MVLGTFSDFFSILDLSWLILAHHGFQDAFKTPPRLPKTPPRTSRTPPRGSKTPPRASKMPPRHPQKIEKNHWFHKVLRTFFDLLSILDLSWLILAQHGLQDAFKTPPRPPKTPPRAPKTPPRASKMPPRRSRGTPKSLIFIGFCNGFAFLGLLGTSLNQHGLQDASKTLQDAFKTLQDAA